MVLDGKAVKNIEFVAESEFGTFPTNPTMLGFGGYVNPASIKTSVETEKIPYMKGADSENRLQSTVTQKTTESIELSFTMKPTSWEFLPYALCASTSSTYEIGDNPFDLSVGITVGSEYQTYSGGIVSKYECTIDKDAVASVDITMKFADRSAILATDYVGTGDHADDPSGNALIFDDLTSILYDAGSMATTDKAHVDSIKFGVEYDVTPIKDVESTTATNVAAWGLGQRNIYIEPNVTLDELDIFGDFVGGSAHTFVFTGLSKTLTFSNIKWEGDFDMNLDVDDIIAMPMKASNVNLAIA